MNNAADVYVSSHEGPNPHNMNTDCFTSTHENTSNMVNHQNDLPMKEFDLTDSDPDYLPSADDQPEITESDGEEYGSKDKMGLDKVHVLHEGTWVAQNDPIPFLIDYESHFSCILGHTKLQKPQKKYQQR